MKDFNFDLHVATGLREEVDELKLLRSKLIEELTDVCTKISKYELHIHIQDSITPQEPQDEKKEIPYRICTDCGNRVLDDGRTCFCKAQNLLQVSGNREDDAHNFRRDRPF